MSLLDELDFGDTPNESSDEFEYNIVDRSLMGVGNSVTGFLDDIVSLTEDVAGWVSGTDQEWFNVTDPFGTDGFLIDTDLGTAGNTTKELGSFALGLALSTVGVGALGVLGKAGKLGKLGNLARLGRVAQAGKIGWGSKVAVEAAKGAGVDFLTGDTSSGNLSNLLDSFPMLKGSVVTFLKHEEDDSKIMKRLKNMMEGIPLGVATDVMFKGLSKILKLKRAKIRKMADGDILRENDLIAKEVGDTLSSQEDVLKRFDSSSSDDIFHELTDVEVTKVAEAQQFRSVSTMPKEDFESLGDQLLQSMRNSSIEDASKGFKDALNANRIDSVADSEGVQQLINYISMKSGKSIPLDEQGIQITKETLQETKAKSYKEIQKIYEDLGGSSEGLKSMRNNLQGLRTKVTAWRAVIVDSAEKLKGFADDVLADGADTQSYLKFQEQLQFHQGHQGLLQDISSEIGGALSAHRIKVGSNAYTLGSLPKKTIKNAVEQDTVSFLGKRIEDFMSQKGGKENLKKLAKKIKETRLNEKGELIPKELTKVMKHLEGNKMLNVIQEFRLINILSGWTTQGVNAMGNALHWIVADVWEQSLTAGYGKLMRHADRATYSEVLSRVHASTNSLKEFFGSLSGEMKERYNKEGLKAFGRLGDTVNKLSVDFDTRFDAEGITGNALSAQYMKLDPNKPLGWFVDAYGKTGRGLAFGTMNLTDTISKNMAFAGELEAQLSRLGREKGWSKSYIDTQVPQLRTWVMDFAVNQKLPNIAQEGQKIIQKLHDQALYRAKMITWQEGFEQGSLSQKLNSWLNTKDTMPQIVKTFVIPFFKTPMNIINFVQRRTPFLYNMTKEYKSIMAAGTQSQKDEIVARLVTGSLMYSGAAGLYQSGVLTGTHDRENRDDLLNAGIPEYAIKIGDSFYTYNRLDPFGYFLGLTADICAGARHLKQGELDELTGCLINAVSANIVSKSYLQNVGELWNVAFDYKRYSKGFLRNQMSALIPLTGFQKSVAGVISPEMKETQNLVDSLLSKTVFKGTLKDKVNSLGVPVITESSPLTTLLGIRKYSFKDEASQQMAKYGLYPRDKEGTIQGVEVTPEQHIEYKHTMQKLGANKHLNNLIESTEYRLANDATRKRALERLLGRLKRTARGILLQTNGDLRGSVIERKKEILKQFASNPEYRQMLVSNNLGDIQDYLQDNKE